MSEQGNNSETDPASTSDRKIAPEIGHIASLVLPVADLPDLEDANAQTKGGGSQSASDGNFVWRD